MTGSWVAMRLYWDPRYGVERRVRLLPAFPADTAGKALGLARARWNAHGGHPGQPWWELRDTYVVPAEQ